MDYVRELQSVELALEQANERGDDDAAAVYGELLPGKVAAVRSELARLEATPPTYGSADYVQDVDPAGRAREALAKYDEEPEQAEEATGMGRFDPSTHDVASTLLYLDGAGEAEAERVLDAEAAGKARKTLVDQRDQILARERAIQPKAEPERSPKENTADSKPKETA